MRGTGRGLCLYPGSPRNKNIKYRNTLNYHKYLRRGRCEIQPLLRDEDLPSRTADYKTACCAAWCASLSDDRVTSRSPVKTALAPQDPDLPAEACGYGAQPPRSQLPPHTWELGIAASRSLLLLHVKPMVRWKKNVLKFQKIL